MPRRQVVPDGPGTGTPWPARVGAAGLAAAVVLAGCDAGQDAETTQEVPDTPGVDGSVGQVDLDDVYLDSGSDVAAGAAVPLRAALTNEGESPDTLTSVTTPAAQSVQLLDENGDPATGGIPLPADGQVDATTGPERMRLEGVTSAIGTTDTVPVTFVFATAGEVRLDVPVGTAG
ncbi:copper chaperone PCu(A)C [Geodermatophilus sp. SYSU D00758]